MAKINLIQNLKFGKLARALQLSRTHMLGHLEMLWLNCYHGKKFRFDDAEDIEIWAEWEGQRGAFVDNLKERGFLDEQQNGDLVIHDWQEHAPYFVKKYFKENPDKLPAQLPDAQDVIPSSNKLQPSSVKNHVLKKRKEKKREEESIQNNGSGKPDPLDKFDILRGNFWHIRNLIKKAHPKAKFPEVDSDGYIEEGKTLARLVTLDDYAETRVVKILEWVFQSSDRNAQFWRKNVRSIRQLRDKKRGDTMTKFDKIAEAWPLNNEAKQTIGHDSGNPLDSERNTA